MTVTLSPELEALIRRKVETGEYQSADQIIAEALQLLDERDRLLRLQTAIAVGDEQLARGEGMPLTPALLAKIKSDARAMLRQGKAPKPDVLP